MVVRRFLLAFSCLALPLVAVSQDRRSRIDVEHYDIDAEVNPRTQSLSATVKVRLTSPDENASSAAFELNNALSVSRVVDEAGNQIPASRSQQDFTVRLSFPDTLKKNQPVTLTFTYDGRLAGNEESPVYGIKFAAINNDYAYLMAPARWFPTTDYATDRYTAELKITVPSGYKVLASGIETTEQKGGDKVTHHFKFTQASFPGSIAIVNSEPVRVSSQGVTSLIYFRGENKAMAQPYGEEIGKVLTFLTSVYGLAPQSNLAVVETEGGTPNAYSAPGLLFISSKSIGTAVNSRLLANQIGRQWWGMLVSPATRNHLWIPNGMARYSELLWVEQSNGPGALESEIRDTYIEALTVENPPLIQAARLEDFSPEYWASTAGKGASVIHMLRGVIGEDKLKQGLKAITEQYAWKSIDTEQFKNVMQKVAGQDLSWFFLQWIESSGAPEFKLEYTVYRTAKGFRVMGKVSQDLDTFRMPVDLKIETEGNPEEKRIEVVGTSSEFVVDTFGKPKKVDIDAGGKVLTLNPQMRVAVAIRRGEQFAEIGEFGEALKEYQKALDVNRNSSLAHYRVAETFFLQNNYQAAANEFREALNGDLEPKWTEVWAHINLGRIFDVTSQRERAVNEYQLAIRTKDNTQGAQEEAAKLLKEPYKRQRPTY
jgi:aminopeptidase N